RVVATYAPRTREAVAAAVRRAAAGPEPPALTLAARGASDYAVIVDAVIDAAAGTPALAALTNAPDARLRGLGDAVADLTRCLQIQSGAELPVLAGGARRGPAIVIRRVDRLPGTDGLQDAYRLRTAGRDVLIESETPEGLGHGVYGLLTDHLDCHWFQSRRLGEEIGVPPDRVVRLPRLDEIRGSRWFSASGVSWGNAPRWDRRNRSVINRGRMGFGHSWYGYINDGAFPYATFPQYYARDRAGNIRKRDTGWTFTNFCSTDTNVLEIVAREVNTFFAGHPDAIVTSLDPNDYAPMCLCDRCLALDRQYGSGAQDGTDVAGRLLHFSREIHARLEPRFQDRYLGILIYGYQMELPAHIRPPAWHAGQICNFPPRYDHSRPWNDPTSEKNRDFHRLVKGWGSLLAQFGYYDYYGHYYYFGPWAVIHKMREDLPAFRELGGTFVTVEAQPNFGMQGLNLYVAARLIWDIDADVDVVLDEFFRKYYGPAAEPLRAFWLAAERHFALERPGTMTESRVAAHPEFWGELDGHLRAAEQAVANLPAEQQRFGDRVRLNRGGFEFGRLHYAYTSQYGGIAARLGRDTGIDHAAAVRFLTENRDSFLAIPKRYPAVDEYWPAIVPAYFELDVDGAMERHQAELKKAP
ncbi:DUF4838 domain-containing protein, partial [bacterium]|nr:DUF4838 domain-containing protein [bacterium]